MAVSRQPASRLALAAILFFVACAVDYAVFLYRQRHGDVLSYVRVRQFVPRALKNGHYEFDYVGNRDVPCVEALLRHQRMAPCWWVSLHSDDWD